MILSQRHLVMATLGGGARRHSFKTADGQRHDGPDQPGVVSFLPARCERRLKLADVEWRWAALAISPAEADGADALASLKSFVVPQDLFVSGLLLELERLAALGDGLEPIYAETMSGALVRYLARRYAGAPAQPGMALALPVWKLRRVKDCVDSRLGERISILELAALCGMSERHFHRAFQAATGQTPLAYLVGRRVARAKLLLASDTRPVAAVAFAVGYSNAAHFAKAFQAETGLLPSAYRRLVAVT